MTHFSITATSKSLNPIEILAKLDDDVSHILYANRLPENSSITFILKGSEDISDSMHLNVIIAEMESLSVEVPRSSVLPGLTMIGEG